MENIPVLAKFKSGKYDKCRELLLSKSWHGSVMKILHSSLSNDTFYSYLEENNILVCNSLENIARNNVLDSFKTILSSYRSLNNTPPELDLNVIHNLLWWFLVKIKSSTVAQLNFNGIIKTALQGLIKVVKLYKKSVNTVQCLDGSEVEVLQLSISVLLHVPGSVSLQMLSVVTLAILILLKNSPELSLELLSSLKTTADQLEMLTLHMESYKSNGLEDLYFKFGFSEANSTASMTTREEVLEAFVLSVSLVCAYDDQFNLALECLEKIPDTKPRKFNLLFNIVKADCFLHLQRLTEAKVCLAYSNAAPMCTLYQHYYRLLLGQVLSAQGCHQDALGQFQAALVSSHPLVSSLAAHQAARQAETLNLSTSHLTHLKQLVQILQETSDNEKGFEGFEDVCLDLLFWQTQVSLPEALYTLSRQSYITGYHMNALNSYAQLLELLKTSSADKSKSLPPKLQILHEVALAHVKANSLQEGEALCRELLRNHVPQADGGGKWETLLYHMDEDIISSILLSDILATTDKRKAIDQLNRCYNMVMEGREQGGEEDAQMVLCDWLLSRTLLRKARLTRDNDAAHYFRRALIHVPGDKEVMYHYKQWALWHPDHQSFDPGDRVCEFPVTEVNDLALRHILAYSVSQEEWDTLFNQDSLSQDVLDNLFD